MPYAELQKALDGVLVQQGALSVDRRAPGLINLSGVSHLCGLGGGSSRARVHDGAYKVVNIVILGALQLMHAVWTV